MKHSRLKSCLIVAFHIGMLLFAIGVLISSLCGSRGEILLSTASLPASVTDDGLVEFSTPVSVSGISPAGATCTLHVGSTDLSIAPNQPAFLDDGTLFYLVDCSATAVRLLCVRDVYGFSFSAAGCFIFILATLLLLISPARAVVHLFGNIRMSLTIILLLIAVSFMLQPANPALPILRTPWLFIHLVPLVAAYALMPVGVWIAITILFGRHQPDSSHFNVLRLLILSIALLLGLGIALGAVWASLSWGRFWGWDIKETWALIAFIAASIPLHFPALTDSGRFPRLLPLSMLLIFLLVIATFLTVNPFGIPSLHDY